MALMGNPLFQAIAESEKQEENKGNYDVFNNVEIVGYRINTDSGLIRENISGKLNISQLFADYIKVTISFNENLLSFSQIHIDEIVEYKQQNGNKEYTNTFYSDFNEGFYLETHEYPSYIWMNLAFSYLDFQYNFDSVLELNEKKNEMQTENTHKEFKYIKKNFSEQTFSQARSNIFSWQQSSLTIKGSMSSGIVPTPFQPESSSISQKSVPRSSSGSRITYAIIHESFELDTDLTDICDDILSTLVTWAIRRYNPTESQVRSDYRYYTADKWLGSRCLVRRDLLYYQMISHSANAYSWDICGNRHWDDDTEQYEWDIIGSIGDGEIRQDFASTHDPFYDYYRDVDDAIILAMACTTLQEDMYEEWIDELGQGYAFIGSKNTVTFTVSNLYAASENFWEEIEEEDTLANAVTALCQASASWTYPNNWDYVT